MLGGGGELTLEAQQPTPLLSLGSSAMDGMDWENSKENFVPVKEGRKQVVLNESAATESAPSASKTTLEQMKR